MVDAVSIWLSASAEALELRSCSSILHLIFYHQPTTAASQPSFSHQVAQRQRRVYSCRRSLSSFATSHRVPHCWSRLRCATQTSKASITQPAARSNIAR